MYKRIQSRHRIKIKDDLASQIEARRYVLEHELIRPKTTKKTPIIIGLTLLVLPAIVGTGLLFIPHSITSFLWFRILAYIIPYLIIIFVGLRPLSISLIKCYQHYTHEDYRRMCLCKPTCSEYALAVLHKYPLIVAFCKIHYRLKVTCTGNVYKIDEP